MDNAQESLDRVAGERGSFDRVEVDSFLATCSRLSYREDSRRWLTCAHESRAVDL